MPRLNNNKGRRSSLAVQPPAPSSPLQSTSNSTSNPQGQGQRARLGVLAVAQNRLQRDSLGGSGGASGSGQRNVSGVLGAAPLVVESQRYEEWMKIATDNVRPSLSLSHPLLLDRADAEFCL